MKVTIDVPVDKIANLLCSAFEGGSNYWYSIDDEVKPSQFLFRTDKKRIYNHIDYPLNPGGQLGISSEEEPERKGAKLNLRACKRGIQLMAEKYPYHFRDVMSDNDDQTTGDVFLQLALYGEVLYG